MSRFERESIPTSLNSEISLKKTLYHQRKSESITWQGRIILFIKVYPKLKKKFMTLFKVTYYHISININNKRRSVYVYETYIRFSVFILL